MARTKQTARKTYGNKSPRKALATMASKVAPRSIEPLRTGKALEDNTENQALLDALCPRLNEDVLEERDPTEVLRGGRVINGETYEPIKALKYLSPKASTLMEYNGEQYVVDQMPLFQVWFEGWKGVWVLPEDHCMS